MQYIKEIKYGDTVWMKVLWSHTETRKSLSKLGYRHYFAKEEDGQYRAYVKTGRKWEQVPA